VDVDVDVDDPPALDVSKCIQSVTNMGPS
jgi:hypothetical protein